MSGGWQVDDMVIHRIVEDERGERPLDFFFPDASPELIAPHRHWFDAQGLDPMNGNMVMSFHSYVVRTPRHNVLIDSCIGQGKHLPMAPTWHNRNDDRWMTEFTATGLKVEDIDYVLCTHLHADHVGWNTTLVNGAWVPTFPNARHVIVDREYRVTGDWVRQHADDVSAVAQSRRAAWEQSIRPIVDAGRADFVAATHVLGDYFRLIPTPGHTPGHVAVGAGRDRDRAVFTGDLIYSPIQTQLPAMRMILDADQAVAVDTRRAFLDRYAGTDTLVCTMHFPAPSAGHLRRWRDGYRLDFVEPEPCCDGSIDRSSARTEPIS